MKTITKNYQNELAFGSVHQKIIFNIKELCDYTGWSKSTIYKVLSNRKVAYYCPGGKMKFVLKCDIDAFLLSNQVPAIDVDEMVLSYMSNSNKGG